LITKKRRKRREKNKNVKRESEREITRKQEMEKLFSERSYMISMYCCKYKRRMNCTFMHYGAA
jgi:hypothetical protein